MIFFEKATNTQMGNGCLHEYWWYALRENSGKEQSLIKTVVCGVSTLVDQVLGWV